jgi:hypothetical protein
MALAVLETENGFRRLDGYEDLPRLQAALEEAISDKGSPGRKNSQEELLLRSFQLDLHLRQKIVLIELKRGFG